MLGAKAVPGATTVAGQPVGPFPATSNTKLQTDTPKGSAVAPSNQVEPRAKSETRESANRRPVNDEKGADSTQVQAEMMHDQLTAPTRIPQDAKRPVTVNEPPPANVNVAGLGVLSASGAINSIFDRRSQPVITPALSKPLAISSGLALGMLIQKTSPTYPPIAKTAGVSGTVELQAIISKTGTIRDLHVVNGPLMLQQAAVDAVRTWRYKPYKPNNQPVEVETTIDVIFALSDGPRGSGANNNIFGEHEQPVAQAAPSRPLAISSGIAAGMLIQKTSPTYPPIAKTAGVSGTVELQAIISKTGTIKDLHAVSGPPMLQQAAVGAVWTWRYKPYKLNNQPVEVETTIDVNFALNDGPRGSSANNNTFGEHEQPVVQAAPSRPLAISSGIAAAMLIRKTPPAYPPIAKTARVSGTVELQAIISKTGSIKDLHVVSGPLMLRQAAVDAVWTWRYKPYKLNNQPVEVETIINVVFALEN